MGYQQKRKSKSDNLEGNEGKESQHACQEICIKDINLSLFIISKEHRKIEL